VVKSCLPMIIVGRRSDGRGSFLALVLFRLVASPLQLRLVGSPSWYGLYGSPTVCRWREPIVSRILARNR
jgi:hypothetical protein